MNSHQQAIGIFDSGIGGLTVLKEMRRRLPGEKILYLGDTARVPYGIRSSATVVKYSVANTDFLLRMNIKLLVIACNTASAVATRHLKSKYSVPIVDVVDPGARAAVAVTRTNRIGIIGTVGTIASNAYQDAIRQLNPAAQTVAQPCPLFVPLAEEGWCERDDTIAAAVAHRYLDRISDSAIDTLVLGCTHYPLLKSIIQDCVGDEIRLIDSAQATADEVARVLDLHGIQAGTGPREPDEFYLTDIPKRFIEIGNRFLGEKMLNVKLVDI